MIEFRRLPQMTAFPVLKHDLPVDVMDDCAIVFRFPPTVSGHHICKFT